MHVTVISDSRPVMAKRRRFIEKMNLRLPEGSFDRLDAVRTPLEDRADVVRVAVERELERREAAQAKLPKPDSAE